MPSLGLSTGKAHEASGAGREADDYWLIAIAEQR
jgi:hypothetical protein